ncbi:MAG TPA: ATP-dependent 6-phosphofructokinase [Spirochaetota bacterium]|nr:ATP-dependent 6-phosphofructokinase [Spirochaetota bacterium]HOD13558.1 ATP-dependent 6-phosphofructokinase [Spirochaetota bacterium]HPG50521.1 ATP-dependent 6-phosphofructokinase [Spirochaetota bacterium]HPN11814.1 ATP-dependent 6-phosphofructokinase [Spirochaetota bacterium]
MDFNVKSLGPCAVPSPLLETYASYGSAFVDDDDRVVHQPMIQDGNLSGVNLEESFEQAGPRKAIRFRPDRVRSAIVTCGGLCPGINAVIRSIVMTSHHRYGSSSITGIRYGYSGLDPAKGYGTVELTPEMVEDIHLDGGTILGSSRGGTEDMELLVETLASMGINILYTIGGDGTLRGAHKIAAIAERRGLDLAVIGIPKTIDNDISFIQRSFGFETAFSLAVESIYTAHIESKGAPNGIGLVKLMGRHSGFIAAHSCLAMSDVNFILVPEVPFDLGGPNGFLAHLKKRMLARHHAVICVAEGAGQDLLEKEAAAAKRDRSGNVSLGDIGALLKSAINDFFKAEGIEVNLKYIDPSYTIRSAPPVPNDSIFCGQLGQNAVHAGMAGKTDMVIGLWNDIYTHVPIELAVSARKVIDTGSRFWYDVIDSTGQPVSMKN